MLTAVIVLSISTLFCPDYGQAMSNEFFMAAPTCNFLACDDPSLSQLHKYTKSMRDRANRQNDKCIQNAIIDYANYLDRDGERNRVGWQKMNNANHQQLSIKK